MVVLYQLSYNGLLLNFFGEEFLFPPSLRRRLRDSSEAWIFKKPSPSKGG